jgi:hypothetical protein
VVIGGGVVGDPSQQAPVAELLADRFAVYNYDRRGHGESGFTEPDAVERDARTSRRSSMRLRLGLRVHDVRLLGDRDASRGKPRCDHAA